MHDCFIIIRMEVTSPGRFNCSALAHFICREFWEKKKWFYVPPSKKHLTGRELDQALHKVCDSIAIAF